MRIKILTKHVVVTTILAVIVYDVVAYAIGGMPATVSAFVLETSKSWPVIPFASGVVCGHLFWPQVQLKGECHACVGGDKAESV